MIYIHRLRVSSSSNFIFNESLTLSSLLPESQWALPNFFHVEKKGGDLIFNFILQFPVHYFKILSDTIQFTNNNQSIEHGLRKGELYLLNRLYGWRDARGSHQNQVNQCSQENQTQVLIWIENKEKLFGTRANRPRREPVPISFQRFHQD